jgi:hypothetical protein
MKTFWRHLELVALPVLALALFCSAIAVYWSMPMFAKVSDEPLDDWVSIVGYGFTGLIALFFWHDLLPRQVARRKRRAERRDRWVNRMIHHIEAEYRDD